MEYGTAPQAILLGEKNGAKLTGDGMTVHDRVAEESPGNIVSGGRFVAGLVGKNLFILSDAHDHFAEQYVVCALVVLVVIGHQRHVRVGLSHEDHAVAVGRSALVL